MKQKQSLPTLLLAQSTAWSDYALLDSGDGMKLERFGKYTFVRPESQAIWRPALPLERWEEADASFQGGDEESGGNWQFQNQLEPRWQMRYKGLRFWAKATSFRHVGVFPEQASQWDWVE